MYDWTRSAARWKYRRAPSGSHNRCSSANLQARQCSHTAHNAHLATQAARKTHSPLCRKKSLHWASSARHTSLRRFRSAIMHCGLQLESFLVLHFQNSLKRPEQGGPSAAFCDLIGWRCLHYFVRNSLVASLVFGWPQLGLISPIWSRYILGSGVELHKESTTTTALLEALCAQIFFEIRDLGLLTIFFGVCKAFVSNKRLSSTHFNQAPVPGCHHSSCVLTIHVCLCVCASVCVCENV